MMGTNVRVVPATKLTHEPVTLPRNRLDLWGRHTPLSFALSPGKPVVFEAIHPKP